MIFLSAQPDTPYFIWQLEVQLLNFSKLKINPESIHVLFGYDEQKGINYKVKDFIEIYKDRANFYTYPDKRIHKKYLSSIRPNIIKQHFRQYPSLEGENIFYHDSDIVFTDKLPDFDWLNSNDTWYFSDANSYLNSLHIKRRGGKLVFREMCEIVGISEKMVEDNDANAGGAQTLLKNVDYDFWVKIEEDCEKLYCHLEESQGRYAINFSKETGKRKEDYTPISSWCADMWALLWNGFMRNEIRIDQDLDFCWPHYGQSFWNTTKIFHNSGVGLATADKYFFKSAYLDQDPFDHDFSHLLKDTCSYKYVEYFDEVRKNKKYEALDATVLIPLRVDSNDRIENTNTVLKYLLKNFNVNIILLEADSSKKIPDKTIIPGVEYVFIHDEDPMFHREKYNNILVELAKTNIVIKYDCDVIIPPSQLYNAIISVRYLENYICYPYDGRFMNVPGVLRSFFIKKLDVKVLWKYIDTTTNTFIPSYGGCIVLNKQTFIKIGKDNENFKGWGFEDQEIYKRGKIMGYNIRREEGPLFHLDHSRGTHSYFFNHDEMLNSYKEYLKVCNMEKNELEMYISTWVNKA